MRSALLAGLWVFLSMLEIMEAYSQEDLDSLKATAQQFLGQVVYILCVNTYDLSGKPAEGNKSTKTNIVNRGIQAIIRSVFLQLFN